MPEPTVQHLSIPLLLLVSAVAGILLSLGGWILSLERRKLDKEDFVVYSSKLESRLQAMQTDITARIVSLVDLQKGERAEIMTEIRDLRGALRHVDECPYLEDLKQRGKVG